MAVLRFLVATQADKFITRFKADLFQHFFMLSETLGGADWFGRISLVEASPWRGEILQGDGDADNPIRRCQFTRVSDRVPELEGFRLAALCQTFIQDFAHLAGQSGRQVRFLEEYKARPQHAVISQGILGISRCK